MRLGSRQGAFKREEARAYQENGIRISGSEGDALAAPGPQDRGMAGKGREVDLRVHAPAQARWLSKPQFRCKDHALPVEKRAANARGGSGAGQFLDIDQEEPLPEMWRKRATR